MKIKKYVVSSPIKISEKTIKTIKDFVTDPKPKSVMTIPANQIKIQEIEVQVSFLSWLNNKLFG